MTAGFFSALNTFCFIQESYYVVTYEVNLIFYLMNSGDPVQGLISRLNVSAIALYSDTIPYLSRKKHRIIHINIIIETCCDMDQNDTIGKIELNPLSSCQVIILIARMTFNCSTSCLMS